MMKIKISTDYSGSPKNELLKNITILFAQFELESLKEYMDEHISWTLVGDAPIVGREAFLKCLAETSHNKVAELAIYNIFSDGHKAAINGEMNMENGDVFGFSDFYQFSIENDKKIKSITSYVIPIIKKD